MKKSDFGPPPSTAQMDGPIDPKIGINVCQEGLFGLVEAIFEFPPQTGVIEQNVVNF